MIKIFNLKFFINQNFSENVLDSTLIHLTEPFTNTELFLIGTMNCSNIMANRTKKLIQDIKPDTLFVQTNEQYLFSDI